MPSQAALHPSQVWWKCAIDITTQWSARSDKGLLGWLHCGAAFAYAGLMQWAAPDCADWRLDRQSDARTAMFVVLAKRTGPLLTRPVLHAHRCVLDKRALYMYSKLGQIGALI